MPFSRRDFLIRSTGFVTVSAMVPRWAVAGAHRFEESVAAANAQRTLVVLELAGGNDGLNTVVPYADALYPQLRSRIGIPVGEVLPLDARLGLNPVHERDQGALGRGPGGDRDERRLPELEPLALRGTRRLAHGGSHARSAARLARTLGGRRARRQRQSALLRRDLPIPSEDASRRSRGRADLSDPRELPVPDRRGASRRFREPGRRLSGGQRGRVRDRERARTRSPAWGGTRSRPRTSCRRWAAATWRWAPTRTTRSAPACS